MDATLAGRLTRNVFMHYDNKGNSILKHYAALKGLTENLIIKTREKKEFSEPRRMKGRGARNFPFQSTNITTGVVFRYLQGAW